MFRSAIFKGLAIIGCAAVLSLPARAQILATDSEDTMSDGDGGQAFDISSGFFGFNNQIGNAPSYSDALITFNAGGVGTGASGNGTTGNVQLAGITILFEDPTVSGFAPVTNGVMNTGATASSACTSPVVTLNGNTVTSGTQFVAGDTTTILCQLSNPSVVTPNMNSDYFVVFSLANTGGVLTGASGTGTAATLEFLNAPPTSAVPEPGTMAATLLGFAGLAVLRRRVSRANRS